MTPGGVKKRDKLNWEITVTHILKIFYNTM